MNRLYQDKRIEIEIHSRMLSSRGPENYASSRWSPAKVERAIAWLLVVLDPNRSYRVLDLGCGGMALERKLSRLSNFEITYLDLCLDVLSRVSRRRVPEGSFVNGDIEALPFGPSTFDLVVHNQTLHHIPVLTTALGEIHRVTKPGGLLYSIEANGHCPWTLYNHLAPWRKAKNFVSDNQRLFGMASFRRALVSAGFGVEWTRIVGLDPQGPLRILIPFLERIPLLSELCGGTLIVLSRKTEILPGS